MGLCGLVEKIPVDHFGERVRRLGKTRRDGFQDGGCGWLAVGAFGGLHCLSSSIHSTLYRSISRLKMRVILA